MVENVESACINGEFLLCVGGKCCREDGKRATTRDTN